jgi:hypothetical protein
LLLLFDTVVQIYRKVVSKRDIAIGEQYKRLYKLEIYGYNIFMSIFSSLQGVFSRVKGIIRPIYSKILSMKWIRLSIIDELHKYRKILMLGAGVIALFLLTLGAVLLINAEIIKKPQSPVPVERSKTIFIPPEDIFLPDEPDFLPEAILEKQPKKWDAQDARPFWTNPLENDPLQWQDNIKNTVDEIMENVP